MIKKYLEEALKAGFFKSLYTPFTRSQSITIKVTTSKSKDNEKDVSSN